MTQSAENDVLRSESGVPLTVEEAARYHAWAAADPDPYRRGFAAGLGAAARVIPPVTSDPDMPCEDCEQGRSTCCVPPVVSEGGA